MAETVYDRINDYGSVRIPKHIQSVPIGLVVHVWLRLEIESENIVRGPEGHREGGGYHCDPQCPPL